MADKSVGELIAAQSVTPTDLFVLEQNGTAKKLTGQILENWLVSFADGHGGIQSIEKLSTNILADTYRITLADTTTFDFVVNNGRGITDISKTLTSGLVDTYTISYNNGTTSKFTVTNGAKGDKGDNAYIWIKYASQKPTEASHSMGDIPDDWIGIYSGNASTAPTDWQQYKWYQIKGEKGDTGSPATLVIRSVTYQVGDSGTIIPSGAWSSSIPVVSQGKYLWTKTELKFNTGEPIVSYSVSRMGIDGSGAVSSVAGVSPDSTGNVPLAASDVEALPTSGGSMEGPIIMNGQPISGLNDPTEDTQAARKKYVDTAKNTAKAYTDASVRKAAPRNLLDNSDFTTPVNQRGYTSYGGAGYTIDRWNISANVSSLAVNDGYITATAKPSANGYFRQYLESKLLFGKTMTFAVKVKNGDLLIASGQYPSSNPTSETTVALKTGSEINIYISAQPNQAALQIRVSNGSTANLEWAALYEGEYTAETLPEYQPKGYAAELAECRRYFYRYESGDKGAYVPIVAGTSLIPGITFPIEMRTMPSVYNFRVRTWTTVGFTDITGNVSTRGVNSRSLKYIELTKSLETSGLAEITADFIADL